MSDEDERRPTNVMDNQPFDEAFDIDDPEEVASNMAPTPTPRRKDTGFDDKSLGNSPPLVESAEESDGYEDQHDVMAAAAADRVTRSPSMSSSSEDEEDDGQLLGASTIGNYDPAHYEHLKVSTEIKELFSHITKYRPKIHELDTMLRPFIPDYIPAVGDIDAFLKTARPDAKPSGLGLMIVDEPCAAQSDATVLDLQLRETSKAAGSIKASTKVKLVDKTQDLPKSIDAWINSIGELHRSKPPQSVHYAAPMPDIETLMQAWPSQFEELLSKIQLPQAALDVTLKEYIDIVCALLDIPMYKSRTQSLHVLFMLYLEFKESQHFNGLEDDITERNVDGDSIGAATTDADVLAL